MIPTYFKMVLKRHAELSLGEASAHLLQSPTPLLKQGQLKQTAQDPRVLNISKNGVSTAFLENLFQHLTTITVEIFSYA